MVFIVDNEIHLLECKSNKGKIKRYKRRRAKKQLKKAYHFVKATFELSSNLLFVYNNKGYKKEEIRFTSDDGRKFRSLESLVSDIPTGAWYSHLDY